MGLNNNKPVIAQRVVTAATFGAVLSIGAVFSSYHILFDLISHFRVQYIVLLIPAFLLAMYARKSHSLLIISLALAIHGYTVTMSMLPVSADVSDTTDFVELKVFNSNLLLVNTDYQNQLQYIATIDPDIIAFEEYTHDWDNLLSTALKDYPHRALQPKQDAFGIALYSKFPIVSGGVERFSQNTTDVVNVSIDLGDRLVQVIALHPPPPNSGATYSMRNELFKIIAEKTATHYEPLIVMGDFNSTPWTAHFTNMETTGKLRNARAGHGFHPTWPNSKLKMPLLIPIDHILVNPKIGVAHFESKHVIGSDHRSIWARLRVY